MLRVWKDQDKKKVNDALKRIDSLNLEAEDRFSKIYKPIVDFHKYTFAYFRREIMNEDAEVTDADWFATVLKIKKKLKKAE